MYFPTETTTWDPEMSSELRDILVLLPTWEELRLSVEVSRETAGVLYPEGNGGTTGAHRGLWGWTMEAVCLEGRVAARIMYRKPQVQGYMDSTLL